MIRRTLAVAPAIAAVASLSLSLTLAVGCSRKKDTPQAAQGKTDDTAAGAGANANAANNANPKNPMVATRAPVRRGLAPITVDEVGKLLPTPAGARVLKEVQKAQAGERVEASFCVDKGELSAIADGIKQQLTEAGWSNVNPRPHPTLKDRINVSAQKQPYMLFGTIQRGAWNGCAGDQGQTYVMMGVHKLDPAAAQNGGQAGNLVGPAGVTGLRPRPNLTPGGVTPRPQLTPQPTPTPQPGGDQTRQ